MALGSGDSDVADHYVSLGAQTEGYNAVCVCVAKLHQI